MNWAVTLKNSITPCVSTYEKGENRQIVERENISSGETL